MNSRRILHIGLMLAVSLALAVGAWGVATVYAASTGPVWVNPGYRFTESITGSICAQFQVVQGATVLEPWTACTGTAPNYTCQNATNYPNASITFQFRTRTNGACTAGGGWTDQTADYITFNTGPTAVTLATLDAQPQPASWLLPVGLAFLTGTMVVYVIRRRRA
jgi:hypothetical protein